MDNKEKNIKKILIIYDDGDTKELEKGMVSTIVKKGNEYSLDAEMANLSGKEFTGMLDGFVSMWGKINNIS